MLMLVGSAVKFSHKKTLLQGGRFRPKCPELLVFFLVLAFSIISRFLEPASRASEQSVHIIPA